jgi:hypothetical protein
MKNLTITTSVALLLTALGSYAQQPETVSPKAFYKGALVTSITGGPSHAIYTTFSSDHKVVNSDMAHGAIDPFIMEYGFTNKVGFGFSRGGERYSINANEYYNTNLPEGSDLMSVQTKYTTFDVSYHPFTTKCIDLSVFGGTGLFKVTGTAAQMWTMNTSSGSSNSSTSGFDQSFNYFGRGIITRVGVRTRIYFSQRFGFMAMVYGFNGIVKDRQAASTISDQKNGSGYATMLTGRGMEFGLCFRIFKQKGVTETSSSDNNSSGLYKSNATVNGALFGADTY